jgi:nitric oxide reductase NorQ protein
MVAIDLDFPPAEIEREIIVTEAGADAALADDLVRLGQGIRRVKEAGLREVASTRTLVSAAMLIGEGLTFTEAAVAAVAGPLTDDVELREGLVSMIEAYAAEG